MQLEEKLSEMKGKTFLYKTFQHTILSYKIEEEKVTIVTDKRWIEIDAKKAPQELRDFLPATITDLEKPEIKNGENLLLYDEVKSEIPNLRKIVTENIKKLQEDKSFIPQAQAINEGINSIVNMLKLEMTVLKLKNGKNNL